MITRYAIFDGTVAPGQAAAFRAAVRDELLPLWRRFPGALAVRVGFGESRDPGAPDHPLILAISYADLATLEAALSSPVRTQSRAATDVVLARFFTGQVHHHVTLSEDFTPL